MTDAPALTEEQLEELRAELERELKRLERSMRTTGEAARPVVLDQSAVGRLSRVDALANQHLTRDLHAREQVHHAELLEALARMEAGTYGRCERCGAAMPYGRLIVFPEARACAKCGDAR
ncbi:MAG TPA: TraR/DksA C4-type zinc finger protein [Gemmatimonadaceae bacterium]|nr:TraR/DksA C4-type zinc finger protein [Gemmatimonadaceae bacterium]